MAIITQKGMSDTIGVTIDLQDIKQQVIVSPQQDITAGSVVRYLQGMAGSTIEGQLLEKATGQTAISTVTILEAAEANNIPTILIGADNLDELSNLNISSEAKARITVATQQGKLALVPTQMVTIGDVTTIGWIELSPDGYAIGVMENGEHQGFVETGLKYLNIAVKTITSLQFLGGLTFSLLSWASNLHSSFTSSIVCAFSEDQFSCGMAVSIGLSVVLNWAQGEDQYSLLIGAVIQAVNSFLSEALITDAVLDAILDLLNADEIYREYLKNILGAAIGVLLNIGNKMLSECLFADPSCNWGFALGAAAGFAIGLIATLLPIVNTDVDETPTPTPPPTNTPAPTEPPTATVDPSSTINPTNTPNPSATVDPSITPTATFSGTGTVQPTATSAVPTPTNTLPPNPTETPTGTPTPTPPPTPPTSTPTPTPTETPNPPTPPPTLTGTPSATPTGTVRDCLKTLCASQATQS